MDLDDVLEDLLEGMTDAVRRRARRATSRATRRAHVIRRRLRRAARAGGSTVAMVFGTLTIALVVAGSPGGFRLVGAALTALVALLAGGMALGAHQALKRDPRSRASRARRRRSRRRGVRGPVVDEIADVDVPHDVEADWDRLLQARQLVQDLSRSGWIEGASLMEVDGLVLRLHRLLVVDGRASSLGGQASPELRRQVADLADLLVALADEAVQLQVQDTGAETSVPATLAHAREHMQSLRAARREVEQIDQPDPDSRPQPGTR